MVDISVFSKNLIQKGFAKGYLKAMIELVEDNTITIEEAAEKVGMDIGSFENKMKKYQLHCYMDEVSTPYEENENPFPRTAEDEVFEQKIIKKYNLVLAEETDEE